jgi:5-methyltetrahydrofolate--homocysteine methyltransferase
LPDSTVKGNVNWSRDFAHPESKYFAVGKIGRDQVDDYHRRKQMDLPAIERWLGPYLNYEPPQAASATSGNPNRPGEAP